MGKYVVNNATFKNQGCWNNFKLHIIVVTN